MDAKAMEKARAIVECVSGGLAEAIRDLEAASSRIPEAEDFHFYSNFEQFKKPIAAIQERSQSILRDIGMSQHLRSETSQWPQDVEESYDWLVGVQDDLLEGVGSALDELGGKMQQDFISTRALSSRKGRKDSTRGEPQDVKVALKRKQRLPVPFHVKSLPRPQDRFDHPADNSNAPFKHLTREALLGSASVSDEPKAEAIVNGKSSLEMHAKRLGLLESKLGHPLKEELQAMAYLDKFPCRCEPIKPKSLSETPFTVVELPSVLREMAAKLRNVDEIAVDLENHHYRSFQGFGCLMQISTRSEDFVVDTLVLREDIGPVLRDIFANSSIRKVIHGSDRDILWLQRDFGIYVCNLFDTGQAARVLNMQSYGLAYLLEKFCRVQPDKRYQLADWRLRPLTGEMLRYAREDTHYLLYVYDMLRQMLEDPPELYTEVCKRSRDLCLQLYEKELITETSFLQLHGLGDKSFTPKQLSIVSALYAWRDSICRKEDESTGYVLPNQLILRLAEEAPEDPKKLHEILKRAHPIASVYARTLLQVIRDAAQTEFTLRNSVEAEVREQTAMVEDEFEEGQFDSSPKRTKTHEEEDFDAPCITTAVEGVHATEVEISNIDVQATVQQKVVVQTTRVNLERSNAAGSQVIVAKEPREEQNNRKKTKCSVVGSFTRPSGGLGAMLFGQSPMDTDEDDDAKAKTESVLASLVLPFTGFQEPGEPHKTQQERPAKPQESQTQAPGAQQEHPAAEESDTKFEEIIWVDKDRQEEAAAQDDETKDDGENSTKEVEIAAAAAGEQSEIPPSLSERYTMSKTKIGGKTRHHRKKKNKVRRLQSTESSRTGKQEAFDPSRSLRVQQTKAEGTQQAVKRRSVFPKTGNRTATFTS